MMEIASIAPVRTKRKKYYIIICLQMPLFLLQFPFLFSFACIRCFPWEFSQREWNIDIFMSNQSTRILESGVCFSPNPTLKWISQRCKQYRKKKTLQANKLQWSGKLIIKYWTNTHVFSFDLSSGNLDKIEWNPCLIRGMFVLKI